MTGVPRLPGPRRTRSTRARLSLLQGDWKEIPGPLVETSENLERVLDGDLSGPLPVKPHTGPYLRRSNAPGNRRPASGGIPPAARPCSPGC